MFEVIFRKHLFSLLVALAIIFLVGIVGTYSWGIGYLVIEVNEANNSKPVETKPPQFNIDAASRLNYRGILAPSAMPTSTPPASTTTPGVQ